MARHPIPTWFYVLVAVRKGKKWLLVQEQDRSWFLPAGRVEPGELLADAARRETLEEAGIPIKLDGLVRVEHTPDPNGTVRCRFIFLAHPADDTPLKSKPDAESLTAGWFTLQQAEKIHLRSPEALELITYLADCPNIAPMSALTDEAAPYE